MIMDSILNLSINSIWKGRDIMGNLVNLGGVVINSKKITRAEILKCPYPSIVYHEVKPEKKGFLSSLFSALASGNVLVEEQVIVLFVAYNTAEGEQKVCLYNDTKFREEYSKIIDTYKSSIANVTNYRENPALQIDHEHAPSDYEYECCSFVQTYGQMNYTEKSLEDILNELSRD